MGVLGTLGIVAALCAVFLHRPVRTLRGDAAGRRRPGFATCGFSRAGKRQLARLSGTSTGVGMLHAARGATPPQGGQSFGLSDGFFL